MAAPVLRGSWGLVTMVINKVTTPICTYNPVRVRITVLTKSHEPPSKFLEIYCKFLAEAGESVAVVANLRSRLGCLFVWASLFYTYMIVYNYIYINININTTINT